MEKACHVIEVDQERRLIGYIHQKTQQAEEALPSDSEEMEISDDDDDHDNQRQQQHGKKKNDDNDSSGEETGPVSKKVLKNYLEDLMTNLSLETTSIKTVLGHVNRQFDLSPEDAVGR